MLSNRNMVCFTAEHNGPITANTAGLHWTRMDGTSIKRSPRTEAPMFILGENGSTPWDGGPLAV